MPPIKKSEYVSISRSIVRKLYAETCFGKGSLYLETIRQGIPAHLVEKVPLVLDALVKQGICGKKKKQHGWKYHLNRERLDKIRQIVREKGRISLVLLL